jgi:hypothetical protein
MYIRLLVVYWAGFYVQQTASGLLSIVENSILGPKDNGDKRGATHRAP